MTETPIPSGLLRIARNWFTLPFSRNDNHCRKQQCHVAPAHPRPCASRDVHDGDYDLQE
jgi:hypothetical protein